MWVQHRKLDDLFIPDTDMTDSRRPAGAHPRQPNEFPTHTFFREHTILAKTSISCIGAPQQYVIYYFAVA
jgi:hypothetical protein